MAGLRRIWKPRDSANRKRVKEMERRMHGWTDANGFSELSERRNSGFGSFNRNESDDCTTMKRERCSDPLTMVFINPQPLDSVYPIETAFCNGTLFPNLNKPFYGGKRR